MNLTELIAKVGVVDVLKAPPSPADSPILTRLRTNRYIIIILSK